MKASSCAIVVILTMCLSFAWAAAPRPSTQDLTAKPVVPKPFELRCSMDARYARLVEMNAEAFYAGMLDGFFDRGWDKPLVIYYSQSQSDTRRLMKKQGLGGNIGFGRYVPKAHALYTHWEMDGGGYSGWGTMFHEIVHAFTEVNYPNMPAWCDEGLACFLGEWSCVAKGKVSPGHPNPWRERILRDKIENGYVIDVRKLMSLSTRRFYADSDNYHTARALFYWLHHEGYLTKYLKVVKRLGYSPLVLAKTVRRSYPRINAELLAFIKKYCYCAAYYKDGNLAKDPRKKTMFFQKALEANPEYQPAILALGRIHYKQGDYRACRDALELIVTDEESRHCMRALELMGDSYYDAQDYASALAWYEKALAYSEYSERGYWMYYSIAHCYNHMKKHDRAREFYRKFLAANWEPERSPKAVAFSKKFIAATK